MATPTQMIDPADTNPRMVSGALTLTLRDASTFPYDALHGDQTTAAIRAAGQQVLVAPRDAFWFGLEMAGYDQALAGTYFQSWASTMLTAAESDEEAIWDTIAPILDEVMTASGKSVLDIGLWHIAGYQVLTPEAPDAAHRYWINNTFHQLKTSLMSSAVIAAWQFFNARAQQDGHKTFAYVGALPMADLSTTRTTNLAHIQASGGVLTGTAADAWKASMRMIPELGFSGGALDNITTMQATRDDPPGGSPTEYAAVEAAGWNGVDSGTGTALPLEDRDEGITQGTIDFLENDPALSGMEWILESFMPVGYGQHRSLRIVVSPESASAADQYTAETLPDSGVYQLFHPGSRPIAFLHGDDWTDVDTGDLWDAALEMVQAKGYQAGGHHEGMEDAGKVSVLT